MPFTSRVLTILACTVLDHLSITAYVMSSNFTTRSLYGGASRQFRTILLGLRSKYAKGQTALPERMSAGAAVAQW